MRVRRTAPAGARTSRLGLLLALAIAVAAALPGAASAATISSTGPLLGITVGDNLACQLDAGDESGEFFGGTPGSCGTFLSLSDGSGSTVYGPEVVAQEFTPVSQTGPTGSGTTASDPYTLTTTVRATDSLTLTEVDSYVQGDPFYTTKITLENTAGAPVQDAVVYHGADCFFGNADEGFGFKTPTGGIACTKAASSDAAGALTFEPGRPEPGTESHYFEGGFGANFEQIASGQPLPDKCDCDAEEDNGASLSWTLSVPAGGASAPGTASVSLTTALTAAPPTATTDAAHAADATSALVSGTAAANGKPTTYWFEYGDTVDLGKETDHQPLDTNGYADQSVSATLPDLIPGNTYYYRVVAKSDLGTTNGEILSFKFEPPGPPEVSTGPVRTTGPSTASLSGTLTPNAPDTTYWFEYGTDGVSFPSRTDEQFADDTGSEPQDVQADIDSLTVGTTYYYRLVAVNDASDGPVYAEPSHFTFHPEPAAATGAATSGGTSATLAGNVTPNGSSVTYRFIYGPSPDELTAGTVAQPLDSTGDSPVPVSADIGGLTPGATYFYRLLVSSDTYGTSLGEVHSFTVPMPSSNPPGGNPPGGNQQPGTGPDTTPAPPEELPPPTIGRIANAVPEKGTVLVKLPAGTTKREAKALGLPKAATGFIPLEQAAQVPVGSTFDTTKGTVGLTTAGLAGKQQEGHFSGAQFILGQSRKNPLTTMSMTGGGLGKCKTRVPAGGSRKPVAAARKRRRSLFSSVHGRFRTRGRNSSATVRGTQWTMTDTCAGTLTAVKRGTVVVRDFTLHKNKVVKAGHKYMARAPSRNRHLRKKHGRHSLRP